MIVWLGAGGHQNMKHCIQGPQHWEDENHCYKLITPLEPKITFTLWSSKVIVRGSEDYRMHTTLGRGLFYLQRSPVWSESADRETSWCLAYLQARYLLIGCSSVPRQLTTQADPGHPAMEMFLSMALSEDVTYEVM